MIPYGKQNIDEDDIESVVNVLKSPLITQGLIVPKFERSISRLTGSKYSVSFNSATSALHSACLALGLTKGDIAWTVPNSFVASANCILLTGANVDFVDIDFDTKNISIENLKEKLKTAKKINKLPKVVIPVHFSGEPTIQEEIKKLSKEYGFKILEDASHAIGASRNKEMVGSCKWSDITVFSFHPVKIITTGEGGMATCNNLQLYKKLNLLRSHGVTRDFDKKNYGDWFYKQIDLGFNYRMTDIAAALGLSQLKKLNFFLKSRRRIASLYNSLLSELPLSRPYTDKLNKSSWHLYVVNFAIKKSKDRDIRNIIYKDLRNNGYGVNVHYIPIHIHPFYKKMGFNKGDFPNSERYYETALSLPIFPNLKEKDQKKVAEIIKSNLL
jgi:UDP-4-amino-4,6-dideoxy-N-acetyl-beta-L-altrosamine transaminase